MKQRYFRCLASDSIYETIRLSLDAAWGHVPPTTCIDRADVAPRDANGKILLAVWDSFCEFDAVQALLPQLMSGGAVEEITEAQYQAALQA